MPNVTLHSTTKHRAQTGRFLQAKNQQVLKNQLDLEKAIIKSTFSTSNSFSSTPHLNKSALVTGLLATMALSAVVIPCVQGAPVKENANREPEPEFTADPLPPEAIRGGVSIKNTDQSSCLVFVSGSKYSCTGTAIAPKVVLTAQHCLFESSSEKPRKLLNIPSTNNLRVYKTNGDSKRIAYFEKEIHEVEAAYLADGYWKNNEYIYQTNEAKTGNGNKSNDLAVLKLKTPIDCTSFYKLPTEVILTESTEQCKNLNGTGGNFTIRGYGKVNAGDNKYLAREAKLQCNNWVAHSSGKGGFYSLSNAKKESAAPGDSGGSLIWNKQGTEYQVGICRGGDGKGNSTYSSLKGRIEAINEMINDGDTSQMLKIGCIKLYNHFSFIWESSQKITLTNTCHQTEQVTLAMGESNKGGIMLGDSTNDEYQKNKIILAPRQSMTFAIPKNKKPVFPLSKSQVKQKQSQLMNITQKR